MKTPFVVFFLFIFAVSISVTLSVENIPLGELLNKVASQAGLKIIVDPNAVIMEPASAKADAGDHPLAIKGKPGMKLTLDREYEANAVTDAKVKKDSIVYGLNPKDGQSALVIGIGEDTAIRPDENLKTFEGFAGITKIPGTIAGKAVEWRQWRDKDHLYCDCSLRLPAQNDSSGRKYKVYIQVISNTTERRDTLVKHVASIQLYFPQIPNKPD